MTESSVLFCQRRENKKTIKGNKFKIQSSKITLIIQSVI